MLVIKKWLPVLFALLTYSGLNAQDTIVTIYGGIHVVHVKKISQEKVHYQSWGDGRKRTHKARKDSLARIRFMDGDVHLYRYTRGEREAILETLNESALYSFGKVQAYENFRETRSMITRDQYRAQQLVSKVTGFSYTSKSFGPMMQDPNYLEGYDDAMAAMPQETTRNNYELDGDDIFVLLQILYVIAIIFQ